MRKVHFGRLIAFTTCLALAAIADAAAPTLTMGTNGLVYTPDTMGNNIPDFSAAGYKGGGVALPTLPNKIILSPVAGGADNTTQIQNAINTVSGLTPDVNGFRGAVMLSPGTYPCAGTLSLTASGVILRGAGPSSILQVTGVARTFITAQGTGSASKTGSTVNITDTYVPCGATSFHVSSNSGFAVGSHVIVNRPQTSTWITAIHMDSTYLTTGWSASTGLQFERTITAISGTQITIDIPICNPIEQTYCTGAMWAFTDTGRMQNSGFENLTISGVFTDVPANELNSLAINFNNAKNCWMKNVAVSGFGNGLTFGGTTKNCVISHCDFQNTPTLTSSDPPAAYTLAGQLSLCDSCTASNGLRYHLVVTQGLTAGPNVFLNCSASGAGWRDSGPHQRWAAGVLFDRMVMTSSDNNHCVVAYENRGDDGSGQGWAQGFSVMWNCQSPQISCQEPSYAPFHYNWCIGGIGTQNAAGTNGPLAEYQNFGTLVSPSSLYLEQLKERLGTSALQNIGYPRFAGNYRITNKSTNEALLVQSASTADNAPITELPYTGIANAKWQFIDLGSGKYEIKNFNSGKALATSGSAIIQTTYTGNTTDQWILADLPGGTTTLTNKASGQLLTVPLGAPPDNLQLIQAPANSQSNQQFTLTSAP